MLQPQVYNSLRVGYQIREEVQKGVMKGITNFYNDFLYTEVTMLRIFKAITSGLY
jgi:hypothetical protein